MTKLSLLLQLVEFWRDLGHEGVYCLAVWSVRKGGFDRKPVRVV